MFSGNWGTVVLVIFLTVLSGIGDSQGFVHSSQIWVNGKFVGSSALKAGLGFSFGILTYWIVVRYLQVLGIVSAEFQTLLWFSITIVGVAIVSKSFLAWNLVDQSVAIAILFGLGWLMYRQGG